MSFAYFRDREYGRTGMGEVVCTDLQGESGDRGVYGSDSQCGGEVFCPKKNI